MNPYLAELLHGAGIGDIIIPKKEFVKEHRHLVELLNRYDIPALRKEANDQAHELKIKGGKVKCGKRSGFIRRLMAENALKHNGQYQNPTFPLHPHSTMFHQAEFKYKDLANTDQQGHTESEYGASPFIIKHFGQAQPVPFERKRGEAPPSEPYSTRTPKKKTQESAEQKEARRQFPEEAEAKSEGKEKEAEKKVEHSTVSVAKPPVAKPVEKPVAKPVAKDEADEKYGEKGDKTGDDYEIPEEARPFITRAEVESLRPVAIKRASLSNHYEAARNALPHHHKWRSTPKIIDKLDVLSSRFNGLQNEAAEPIRKAVDSRIEESLGDSLRGSQYRQEKNRLYKLAWSAFDDMVDNYKKTLPAPRITKENVDTYTPKWADLRQ